jgi:hypothetical protein
MPGILLALYGDFAILRGARRGDVGPAAPGASLPIGVRTKGLAAAGPAMGLNLQREGQAPMSSRLTHEAGVHVHAVCPCSGFQFHCHPMQVAATAPQVCNTMRRVLVAKAQRGDARLSPAWKRSSFLAGLWLGLPRPPPGPDVSRKLATRSGLPAAGRPSSSDCSSCWYAGLESCRWYHCNLHSSGSDSQHGFGMRKPPSLPLGGISWLSVPGGGGGGGDRQGLRRG